MYIFFKQQSHFGYFIFCRLRVQFYNRNKSSQLLEQSINNLHTITTKKLNASGNKKILLQIFFSNQITYAQFVRKNTQTTQKR